MLFLSRGLCRRPLLVAGARQDIAQAVVPLVAGELVDRAVGSDDRIGDRPRSRPGRRIFDREPVVDGVGVDAREPFDQMEVRARAAGLRFVAGWSALRSFGQYIQYRNPLGADGTVNWGTGFQTTVNGFTISNIQVWCGSSLCSSGNLTQIPKYFKFTTTVTLAPIVWRPVLCPSSCSARNQCSSGLPVRPARSHSSYARSRTLCSR